MKEIKSILEAYGQHVADDVRMALATVVHVEQSSYRRSGARMLISSDGQWSGGISGGCLEGDTLKKAQYAIFQNKPVVVRYDTREGDDSQIGIGLGCNGLIDVLITPIDKDDHYNPIAVLKGCVSLRRASVLVTIVESIDLETIGRTWTSSELPSVIASRSEVVECIDLVRSNRRSLTRTFDNEKTRIFIEYLPPAMHLVLVGNNYDAIPLARLAKAVGWEVTVMANPQKTSRILHDLVRAVIPVKGDMPILDDYTAVVLLSHDYNTDKGVLRRLADAEVPYLGMLGPKKRADKMFGELESDGLELPKDNVYAPIGLDTGATTPEEVAVSIIAGIRAHFSNRDGRQLRDRVGEIHTREDI